MSQFLDALWQIILQAWPLIVGAVGVSVATQIIKRAAALENAKVVQVLVGTMAFLATSGQWLFVDHNMPATIFGLSTAALVGVAQPIYFFVVKPLDAFITNVRAFTKAQDQTLQPGSTSVSSLETQPTAAALTPPAPKTTEVTDTLPEFPY